MDRAWRKSHISALLVPEGRTVLSHADPTLDLFAAGREFEPGSAVVFPRPPSAESPAVQHCDRMEIDGLVATKDIQTVLVATDAGTYAVPIATLRIDELDAVDPAAGWFRIHGRAPARVCTTVNAESWATVRRRSVIAASWELIGIAQEAADLCEYASAHAQSGARLVSDVRVHLRTVLDAIAACADGDDAGWMSVKALAAKAARESCSGLQQLCETTGFAANADLRRRNHKMLMLDALFGGHQVISERPAGKGRQ